MAEQIRYTATEIYQEELEFLKKQDRASKPKGWQLSPQATVDFIMGKKSKGFEVSAKYIGDRRRIEVAVGTLASDRALLMVGVPGTAKSWISENLAAAISGDVNHIVQGSSGMYEESLKYSWNYALLLSKGPTEEALVPSPILKAMQSGKIARIEELTRIPSEVQDALIMILSEKSLPIPELNQSVSAVEGFNIIATANDKDKGVNELSSALQRRFNVVQMPLPASLEEEVEIVKHRLSQKGHIEQKALPDIEDEIQKLVQIFRELRTGITEDKQTKFNPTTSTLSTGEAISVAESALALSKHFSNGKILPEDFASSISGAIIKFNDEDKKAWTEYLDLVVRKREDWKLWYEACKSSL